MFRFVVRIYQGMFVPIKRIFVSASKSQKHGGNAEAINLASKKCHQTRANTIQTYLTYEYETQF